MTQLILPYELQDGQRAYAAKLMANLNALLSAVNETDEKLLLLTQEGGASTIGAKEIPGVNGNTVQALLEGLKALSDSNEEAFSEDIETLWDEFEAFYTKPETDALLEEKVNNEDITSVVVAVSFDAANGILTFTKKDGSKESFKVSAGEAGGVLTFNGRGGNVDPQAGDYTAEMVGADPSGAAAAALEAAKQHTAEEIAKIPAPDVSAQIAAHNTSEEAHADIRQELASVATNENLLYNWYLANPVNTKGQAEYNVDWGYTIDGWKASGGSIRLTDNGVYLTAARVQFIQVMKPKIAESLEGKQLTISILDGENNLHTKSYVFTAEYKGFGIGSSFYCQSGLVNNVPGSVLLGTESKAETIKAVKLELGDTQTLAHQENGNWVLNEIPKFEEQAAICAQYDEGEYVGAANTKYATGSYDGTGYPGTTVLTFDFLPKFVFINKRPVSGEGSVTATINTLSGGDCKGSKVTCSVSGTTITIGYDSNSNNTNISGKTYDYVAIG